MGDVGARSIPEIVVFNKSDLVSADERLVLQGLAPGAHFVSSRTGEGIEQLRAAVEATLPLPAIEVRALVPYDRGDLISAVHDSGVLITSAHEEGGTAIHAHVSERLAAELKQYRV